MENNDNLNEENQPLDGGDLNNRGRIIPVNIEEQRRLLTLITL